MDIAKFNQELKTKVALAKSCEIRNETESAIKLWLEISEMTINFSKSRKISANYKNMLIKRTTSILMHIKDLKAGQIEKGVFDKKVLIRNDQSQEDTTLETYLDKPEDVTPVDNPLFEENTNSTVIEQSEFNNLPQGFKELQTSDDFKIVTPHDGNYVEKVLNRENSSKGEIKKDSELVPTTEKKIFDIEQSADNNTIICFACGTEQRSGTKICKSCGTELN